MKASTVLLVGGLSLSFLAGHGVARAERSGEKSLLTFSDWKQKQIIEARNAVVRLSNRVHLIKNRDLLKGRQALEQDKPGDKKKTTGENKGGLEALTVEQVIQNIPVNKEHKHREAWSRQKQLKGLQAEWQRAIEKLQFAKDLVMADYVAVYLQEHGDHPKALGELAETMPRKEMEQLLQVLLKKKQQGPEASRSENNPLLGVLEKGESQL